jgi:hypothetical protein
MTHLSTLRATLAATAVLLLPLAHAANLPKAEYGNRKTAISADYKTDKAACSSQSGNAKDICVEEAKAKEKVARAELEFSYSGKTKDHSRVGVAKADAAFSVAKEKCDDLAGNPKSVCREEAKTVHTKALADNKLGKEVGEARSDAAQTKRDADYKLAAEKCDALAGDAKAQCVTTAKSTFGKM